MIKTDRWSGVMCGHMAKDGLRHVHRHWHLIEPGIHSVGAAQISALQVTAPVIGF